MIGGRHTYSITLAVGRLSHMPKNGELEALRSRATAAQIKVLAGDIGLSRLRLVGNKVRDPSDRAYIEAHAHGLRVLGPLPSAAEAQQAHRAGQAAYDAVPALVTTARVVAASFELELNRQRH